MTRVSTPYAVGYEDGYESDGEDRSGEFVEAEEYLRGFADGRRDRQAGYPCLLPPQLAFV